MGSIEDAGPTIDELIGLLQARVEQRRQAGSYPPDLEERMSTHFERISQHRIVPNLDDLQSALEDLRQRFDFAMERTPVTSRVPGGQTMHKALAKAQARQVVGVLQQMREFADGVWQVLMLMVAALENPNSHVHADLVGQIDAVLDRTSGYERAPVTSPEAVADIRRRVEQLEEAEKRRAFRPWFGNDRFEQEFRGSHTELLDRYRPLAQRFIGAGPVVDIGCGRGEFLELLREVGVVARGIELDPDLVADVRRRGLDAEVGDGLESLKALPDRSLGGIVLNQVVEHLTAQEVVDLVLVAYDKLQPGGIIVCETVNPQSLYVFAHSFYVDPTHVRPVHPAYLAFLFREAGFSTVEIDWRTPPPDDDVLEPVNGDDEMAKRVNANVSRLNQLLFAPQEFALIATR
jgi:SAM-dependent methyltransferase